MRDADDVEPADQGDDDPIRRQLLEAASRVFASQGYAGTKIMDIVREAGLSSGAVYGRFTSKDELLTEAIVSSFVDQAERWAPWEGLVGEALVLALSAQRGPLEEHEALQLEAFLAARRDREVAAALAAVRERTKAVVDRFVSAAVEDGTASPELDARSLLYFMEAVRLGLLVQRGAGLEPPEPEAWDRFVEGVVRSMAPKGRVRVPRRRGAQDT